MEFRLLEGGSVQLEDIPHFPDGSAPGCNIWENAPNVTPTYVQSLGIMLCETYEALHERGLYLGTLHGVDVHISPTGRLSVEPSGLSRSGSAENDVRELVSFLRMLLPEAPQDPAYPAVSAALLGSWSDAASLRRALMGAAGRSRRRARTRGIVRLLLCVFCLGAAIMVVRALPQKIVPASTGVDSSTVDPGVIGVWVPLQPGQDEKAVAEMYTRLAAGFERANPGCGVNVRIYADDSFGEALIRIGQESEQPAVFMDTQDQLVLARAADLAPLTASLPDAYTVDMASFSASIPLGCSIPALYYNTHYGEKPETKSGTISFDSLPSGTLYDESVTSFLSEQSAAQEPGDYFDAFLEDGSEPVLASSSLFEQVDGSNTGAVEMLPVTAPDGSLMQYEMYCTVNDDVPVNAQRIGMLWIGYLLTEEAQEIMFVEHAGDLPLHEKALNDAISAHSGLDPVRSILKNGGVR
ncbi:MAG: hypothetical protein IKI21_08720 [Oscillospiraceae bacterium]|nr:hypothetical protein [Oscillospiraceae bacterium]